MEMFNNFYKVSVSWSPATPDSKRWLLSLWRKTMGATVWGVSLPPPTKPNLHEIIKSHAFAGKSSATSAIWIHCAQRSKVQPAVVFTWRAGPLSAARTPSPWKPSNQCHGTAHLLKPSQSGPVVHGNCRNQRQVLRKSRMGICLPGRMIRWRHDIYSMSKAATELIAQPGTNQCFNPALSWEPSPRCAPEM